MLAFHFSQNSKRGYRNDAGDAARRERGSQQWSGFHLSPEFTGFPRQRQSAPERSEPSGAALGRIFLATRGGWPPQFRRGERSRLSRLIRTRMRTWRSHMGPEEVLSAILTYFPLAGHRVVAA